MNFDAPIDGSGERSLFRPKSPAKRRWRSLLGGVAFINAILVGMVGVGTWQCIRDGRPIQVFPTMTLLLGSGACLFALAWYSPTTHRLRIDHRGIMMTVYPRRWPRCMRWPNVSRICWQHRSIRIRHGRREIALNSVEWSRKEWLFIRERVQSFLASSFDFATPTPAEVALRRIANLSVRGKVFRWMRLVTVSLICSFMVLPPAWLWINTEQEVWRIVTLIAIFAPWTIALIIVFASPAVRGIWRYRRPNT